MTRKTACCQFPGGYTEEALCDVNRETGRNGASARSPGEILDSLVGFISRFCRDLGGVNGQGVPDCGGRALVGGEASGGAGCRSVEAVRAVPVCAGGRSGEVRSEGGCGGRAAGSRQGGREAGGRCAMLMADKKFFRKIGAGFRGRTARRAWAKTAVI